MSWGLVRNSESWTQPQMQWIQIIILRRYLVDLHVGSSLRRSCLWKSGELIQSLPLSDSHHHPWPWASCLSLFFSLFSSSPVGTTLPFPPDMEGDTNEEYLKCKLIIEVIMITWNLILTQELYSVAWIYKILMKSQNHVSFYTCIILHAFINSSIFHSITTLSALHAIHPSL